MTLTLRVVAAAAVWLAGATHGVRAQFTAFEAEIAAFDAAVAAGVAEDRGGAVAVAVFDGPDIVWRKGWGWADIEHRAPATAETIGRTGSISKSFTAVLMMRLAENGVIRLDDPVRSFVPEVDALRNRPADAGPITFRMLASHTAGLDREPEWDLAAVGPLDQWESKVLQSLAHTGFRGPPGAAYGYSNIGIGLLGLALSRAAGVPFMPLMETVVFAPLDLQDATFAIDTPEREARLAVGYERDSVGRISAAEATREHAGRGYKVPNGGVYATVGDLARFAAAVMGAAVPGFLSDAGRAALLSPQAPADSYGLGFMLWELDGETLAGHAGCVAGYDAFLAFDPRSGLGVAVLRTTTFEPPAREFLLRLIRAQATGAEVSYPYAGYAVRRLPVDECVVP